MMHTNMFRFEIDDSYVCFIGIKYMGKGCVIMDIALLG